MYREFDLAVRPYGGKASRVTEIPDLCYFHLQIDIITGRILGLLLLTKESDGTFTTKYLSRSMLYFLCVLSGVTYLWCSTVSELLDYIHGNRVPGSYILFILLFNHPLPIIFVAEAKKINKFFTSWMDFQVLFRNLTQTTLDFPCRRLKLFVVTVKFSLFLAILLMIQYQFPKMSLNVKLLFCYYYWMVSMLTSLWYMLIYYLYKTAEITQNLAEGIIKGKIIRLTISDIETIWIDLYKLAKRTGRTFCFTYCYFILILFLALIVTTYESLVILDLPVTGEKVVFVCLTLTAMIHTASIPFTTHLAVKKMGEDFYKLLIDLKIKGNGPVKKSEEIDCLLQTISDNHPLIDLGGFVTLDNSLITSLMSTMVTYLIVLVQFRV